MARFAGIVGYVDSVESDDPDRPGVFVPELVEFPYRGDVVRNMRKFDNNEALNGDISLSNSVSIVADAYAMGHFFLIRYVKWGGAVWTVTNVEVRAPRLILQLGGLYNGQTL